MKLEKKHYTMIIAGAVILFVIYWLFFRKKSGKSDKGEESGYKVTLKKGVWMERGDSCTCPKTISNPADGFCPKGCTYEFD